LKPFRTVHCSQADAYLVGPSAREAVLEKLANGRENVHLHFADPRVNRRDKDTLDQALTMAHGKRLTLRQIPAVTPEPVRLSGPIRC